MKNEQIRNNLAAAKVFTICFLLDKSSSMAGPAIDALNKCMGEIYALLKSLEVPARVKIAVVSFGSDVTWQTVDEHDQPMAVDVQNATWVPIEASGMTYLGKCLREVNAQLDSNHLLRSATGLKTPAFIVLSDGAPNDEWRSELAKIQQNAWFQHGTKIAIALGPHANRSILGELVSDEEAVLETNNLEELRNLMQAVSLCTTLKATEGRGTSGSTIVNEIKNTEKPQEVHQDDTMDHSASDVDVDPSQIFANPDPNATDPLFGKQSEFC